MTNPCFIYPVISRSLAFFSSSFNGRLHHPQLLRSPNVTGSSFLFTFRSVTYHPPGTTTFKKMASTFTKHGDRCSKSWHVVRITKMRVLRSTELKILSWAPTSYNPYKWPYKYSEMGNWGERNPILIGVITPFKTVRGLSLKALDPARKHWKTQWIL